MAYTWPLPLTAVISQRFGTNPYSPVQPSGHTGMDFAVPAGTSVKAIGDGTVLWADWATKMSPANPWFIAPGYAGIVVLIDHGDLITVSAHLSETPLNAGQRVKQGQEIGKSGNTGLSTGPHLHMEVIPLPLRVTNALYGRADPLRYMSAIVTASNSPLAANQRRVGPDNVNHRREPKVAPNNVVRVIKANTTETFTGYVIGESVTVPGIEGVRQRFVSNIWYKDKDGYAWAGGFTEAKTAGLPNLTPAPPKPKLAANERVVISGGAVQRAAPDRTAAVVREIKGGTTEAFTGYVHGQPIDGGSDIWFKDTIGYVWSGGFIDKSTTGLKNLTPPVGTRQSGPAAVAYRESPTLDGALQWYLPANTTFVFDAFTHGDTYGGSDIWYRGRENKFWAHASLFTSQYTGGLTEVKYAPPVEAKPEAVKPPVKPEPEAPKPDNETYSFTPDFDFVEYKPANYWNMGNGNFPTNPQKIVLHQFDKKEIRPSLDGVISHFQTARKDAPSSAHFGVSKGRIVQFVSLQDRAYHAGPYGNDYIGIEIDPQEDAETIASVKKLIKALNKKYGKTFTYSDHRTIPSAKTLCGADIHLEKYDVTEKVEIPVADGRPTIEDIEAAERVLAWAKRDLIE